MLSLPTCVAWSLSSLDLPYVAQVDGMALIEVDGAKSKFRLLSVLIYSTVYNNRIKFEGLAD